MLATSGNSLFRNINNIGIVSDIIRLLPDSVANQIAAGEVIKYPYNVIKELVENAVDAGATDIRVTVRDGGKTMMQVCDNGKGMSETDARMAFERHATSKIRKADDLFSLTTMGFRGEALPSICAISEVQVKTRPDDSQMGTYLVIAGSKVETQEPCVCDRGTVITVKRLFFNVPARRKFLKSDNVELSRIMREFERLALVNNNIHLSLDTGTRIIDLPPAPFIKRIGDLWKNNLNMQLLPVDVETSLIKIEGYISRPEFARRRNALQFMMTNGRNMRHPPFHKTILSCYESLIASDTQPCYFLKFTVSPDSIDVNRHPTKDEILFEYEQQIIPILAAAVKASLGKFSAVPSIDFSSDVLPVDPLRDGEMPKMPDLGVEPDYNPFKHTDKVEPKQRFVSDWEKLYENFENPKVIKHPAPAASPAPTYVDEEEKLFDSSAGKEVAPLCLQYENRYIITPSREGLLIIDQYRAHVKILYEEYMRRVSRREVVSQSILFPESVSLDSSQRTTLEEIGEELNHLGFALEYESDNNWLITGVPAMLGNKDPKDLILKMLDSVNEDSDAYGKEGVTSDSIASRTALLMARATAITRGTKLSTNEMEHIIGSLFSLPDPVHTPTGSTVFCILSNNNINRLFS